MRCIGEAVRDGDARQHDARILPGQYIDVDVYRFFGNVKTKVIGLCPVVVIRCRLMKIHVFFGDHGNSSLVIGV